jgi:hypothetical protein
VFARSHFPVNSDYFPVIDQRAPLARFRGDNAHELRNGREGLVPVLGMLDGEVRTPLARVRRGVPDAASPIARARAATEAVGILLTGRADAAQLLSAEERAAALLAHGLLDGCEGAQGQWTSAVLQVLGLASSVLERADVNIAFDRVRGSRCYQSLDEFSRSRIALQQSINDRDGEGMRRHGEALLAREGSGLDPARPTWLMAALTGHIAVGDKVRARSLWNEHAGRLTPAGRAAFPMRVLRARLAEGA